MFIKVGSGDTSFNTFELVLKIQIPWPAPRSMESKTVGSFQDSGFLMFLFPHYPVQ